MKETARKLGFRDIAHFSKFFRQNVGMTFSAFKATFQNLCMKTDVERPVESFASCLFGDHPFVKHVGKFGQDPDVIVLWITSGSGLLKADSEDWVIGENTLHCFHRVQSQEVQLRGKICGYHVRFSKNFVRNRCFILPDTLRFSKLRDHMKIHVSDPGTVSEIDDIFQEMIR